MQHRNEVYMVTLKDNDAKEKETVLKDDASIYQKRDILKNPKPQTLSGFTLAGKAGWLAVFSCCYKNRTGYPKNQGSLKRKTGLFTGKINISFDRIPSIYFQLLFGSKDKMPKLSLYVRSMGVAAALFEITPTFARYQEMGIISVCGGIPPRGQHGLIAAV